MAAGIAIFLSIITITLLLIFLFRFKKLFSTDQIIKNTKAQLNRMITDINGQSKRDIDLVRESSNRLKALLNDADRKMEQFREASSLLRDVIAEAEKLINESGKKTIFIENKNVSDIKPVRTKRTNSYINPNDAYEIKKPQQKSLFDDFPEQKTEPILKDETTVTPDGAAYKHVPLIITNVYDDKEVESREASKPEIIQTQKKDFTSQVKDLFGQGLSAEQIAEHLSCTVTEVKLIIEMNL